MRVGVFQFNPHFGDTEVNRCLIEKTLQRYRPDLWVLPELCTTGYQFLSLEELGDLAEPIPSGPTVSMLETVCRQRGIHVVAGLAEKTSRGCYNSAVLVGPSGLLILYRKIHLFDQEKRWFLPGDQDLTVYDTGLAKLGLMICFDWIFPEAARTLALKGADIICHPVNLVLPFCQDAMVTRSLENRVFTVTANRIGQEKRDPHNPLEFTGGSQVVSPSGEVLVRMDAHGEGVEIVEVDPRLARSKKVTAANDLWEDRRPCLYGELIRTGGDDLNHSPGEKT